MGKLRLRNRIRLLYPLVRPEEALRHVDGLVGWLLHVRHRGNPAHAQGEETEGEGKEGSRAGRQKQSSGTGRNG